MWSCNDFRVVVTAAAVVVVHVTTAKSSSSSISSAICYDVTECHVNGSPSKMCDRTGKGCHPCLSDRENDSLFSMLHLKAEYNCFAVRNDGECPSGTTKCATTLTKEDEDVEQAQKEDEDAEQEEKEVKFTTGSAEAESPEQNPFSSLLANLTKDELDSSGSALSEPTSLNSSSMTKHGTPLAPIDSASGSSATSGAKKKSTTEEPMKPVSKSLPLSSSPSSDDSSEEASSASASANSESLSKSSSAQELDSIVRTSAETFGSEEELADNVSETVAPVTKSTTTQSTIRDTALSEKNRLTNGAPDSTPGTGINFGLILGIVGGATAIAAVAAFVVWKKNEGGDDSDDEEAAFSPSKPASTHKATALPSASSATTAYSAHTSCFESDNLEYQYDNDQHHNYGGGGYGGNGFPGATATQYADGGGVAPGTLPVNYGHPFPIDIDDDDNNILRRTDSILGGTGVMASTTSSLHNPFEFTAGSSYAMSDTDQDLRDSGDELHGASTVSVEF
uniref:Uncharacterized protein n=1 Tax=Peronospora matthiolae TaxID=2874970 RepID=A0AAV1UPT4_9STRA